MRPAASATLTSAEDLAHQVTALGRAHGLDAVGITSAAPLARARAALDERKAAGLDGGMAFTYRNPARSTTPDRALAGAAAIVVGARRYPAVPPTRSNGPTRAASPGPQGRVARYAWGDHYGPLRDSLHVIARHLKAHGHRAVVLADDNALVDREVAYRAGLGWYGKNANLLLPGGRGSWYVLGSVVTTAPLPPAAAPVADGCGSCRRCLDGCPTGAIIAPGVVDAGRCLAWLLQKPGLIAREHRDALGDRIYGCDDCQEVCPPNLRVDRVASAGQVDRTDTSGDAPLEPWVPVLDLLADDDATLLAQHGRWYLAERDPRWLRRNALVALGNSASADEPGVVGVLRRYLRHADPLLRAHAVWACRRLGRHDLLAAVADDPSPEVRDELERAIAPSPDRGEHGAMKHLLVTNDFPPKIGGIQSYLWELWRRLPADSFAVLTSPHGGAEEWDRRQPFLVRRVREPVLLPHPIMVNRVEAMAAEIGAGLVVVDPALPLGLIGPSLELPYDVVLHGAEVTVPGRLPGSRPLLAHVLRRARRVITAGGYPAAEGERAAERPLDVVVVPPGVDVERFHPLDEGQRALARSRFGIAPEVPLVVSVSRLVPRKGFDTLIRAAGRLRARVARPGGGDRGLRAGRGPAASPDGRGRGHGHVPGPGSRRGPPEPLRVCGRLRHALPQPLGRARAGGLRHRLPGGSRLRHPPARRGQRGRRRGRAAWRDRAGRGPPGRRRSGRRGALVPSRRCRLAGAPRSGVPAAGRGGVHVRRAGGPAGRSAGRSAVNADPRGAGRTIIVVDAVGTALFALTATLEAVLLRHWTEVVGVAVAMALFALGCLAFLLGYARAVQRSRTDEIAVTSLFLLIGPAVPGAVKRMLGLLLAAQIVVAITSAPVRPFTPLAFGILVPVFGVGLNGLWAARHGRFPPRRPRSSREDHHAAGEMEQNADHG